jgi:hypothetical protein
LLIKDIHFIRVFPDLYLNLNQGETTVTGSVRSSGIVMPEILRKGDAGTRWWVHGITGKGVAR